MKWFSVHWKQIQFAWHAYWLRQEYQHKLTAVYHDRWVNSKLGLMTRDRQRVHEWYAKEFNDLYQKYCK